MESQTTAEDPEPIRARFIPILRERGEREGTEREREGRCLPLLDGELKEHAVEVGLAGVDDLGGELGVVHRVGEALGLQAQP